MTANNALYAQSGGVTAVINASAKGVISAVQKTNKINKLYAGLNGIIGVLQEDLIDVLSETPTAIAGLLETPGGAFGSCRYKLRDLKEDDSQYKRLIEVFKAHDIGYFFYNGGGDSQDTAYKVSQISQELGFPITCIGIPKTIDNDLAHTDNCPGFGSVAKYIATSTLEASLDIASMAKSSTKVFIFEVMGRNTGWIAASAGLAARRLSDPPHMILFPEIPFNQQLFCKEITKHIVQSGFCVIVASEGIKDQNGNLLSAASKDAFGHAQLGGVAIKLASIVKENLGLKYHYAIADYLQRSARHIASKVDVEQAHALGEKAVEFALQGKNAIMPTIVRVSNEPYQWQISEVSLKNVANLEKNLPDIFIDINGFKITQECKEYLLPLIQGEAYPSYVNGIPNYTRLQKNLVPKKLVEFAI